MLDDLLDEEPVTKLRRQAKPGAVDDNGVPIQGVQDKFDVQGRFVLASGNQIAMWLALGIQASYEFFTFTGEVLNGDFLYSADGRTFRVTGARAKRYTKGSIETYFKYPCEEISTGATSI